MRRLALLLASCATVTLDYARPEFLTVKAELVGPRAITLMGPEGDVGLLDRALSRRGFEVELVDPRLEGVLQPTPRTRYLARIDGVCGAGNFARPTLVVEVVDVEQQRRVFEVHVADTSGCPETFFEEAALELLHVWREPDAGER